MSPPEHPQTITGRCNCGATRYKIDVPPFSARPLHPNTDTSSRLEPIRLPYTFTDQCNDCRRATGSILNAWITAPIDTVVVNCHNLSACAKADGHKDKEAGWRDASKVFTPDGRRLLTAAEPLAFYESSPGTLRTFCGLCGTNLTYWSESLPGLLDVVLGTLDRACLEGEGGVGEGMVERHMWWGKGLDWVKRMVERGDQGREVHEGDDVNVRHRLGGA